MRVKTERNSTELWHSDADEKPLILSKDLLKSLLSRIADADEQKPLVLLSPSGIAGADIKEMSFMTKKQAYDFSKLGTSLVERILTFPSMVILLRTVFCLEVA